MDFEELIELARDSYVGQFAHFADMQNKAHPEGVIEVKLEVSEEAGLYRSLYCADYLTGPPGDPDMPQIVELAPDSEVAFEAVVVTLNELEMTVEALDWHEMNIAMTGAPATLQGLDAWFETWFDPEDQNVDLDSRFSGHIHSLLVDGEHLHIDFGTAPVQAFVDLMVLIEMNGCSAVRVF
ncbi:MAG: hypothetical protein QM667_01460 [Asticcacaulis sp.]